MARSKFELVYSDGTREQIGAAERNSLLLSREIKPLSAERYKFIGQAKSFSNFIDLAQWFTIQKLSPEQMRRYLANLAVMYELASEKELQLEETPEAFGLRLEAMGCEPLVSPVIT